MVSYCSPLNDRLLTKRLIEISNCSTKSFHNFVNTSQWTDGLDHWSSVEIPRKTISSSSRHNMNFSSNLGLYLPQDEKLKSSTKSHLICSTNQKNNLFPKRLQKLFKKEKNLLKENQTNEQISSEEDNQSSNLIQQSNSNRIKSNIIRFPLRQVQSSSYSKQNREQICQSSNQDKFRILLKKQLNKLLTKETNHLNCKGTLLTTPSTQNKSSNQITRTTSAVDSITITERYNKLRQVLISPSRDETIINYKSLDNRQSPVAGRGSSILGLTVTPLAFSSSKSLHNTSSETINQQDNNSLLNRSLNQSISRLSSNHPNEEQQRIGSKRHMERGSSSTSDHFLNKHSIDDQTRSIRNFHRHHHRPPSKTQFEKTKISQLLPTVVSEKCLLLPIANQRYF